MLTITTSYGVLKTRVANVGLVLEGNHIDCTVQVKKEDLKPLPLTIKRTCEAATMFLFNNKAFLSCRFEDHYLPNPMQLEDFFWKYYDRTIAMKDCLTNANILRCDGVPEINPSVEEFFAKVLGRNFPMLYELCLSANRPAFSEMMLAAREWDIEEEVRDAILRYETINYIK